MCVMVKDLLLALLDEVTADEPARLSPEPAYTHDFSSLVRENLSDMVTTNFCLKDSRVEVFQLHCLEQRASGWLKS